MNGFSTIEQRLLNEFQRDFPLVSRPFLAIGEQLGIAEQSVIERLAHLNGQGVVSRVGPVFSPGSIGASVLVALAVPTERLEATAEWISAMQEVNHNYQREHHYNLWFVVAALDEDRVERVLEVISQTFGHPMLVLPLVEQFHIDLGFDLNGRQPTIRCGTKRIARIRLDAVQKGVVAALQSGIPLVQKAFAAIGNPIGLDERQVIHQVSDWLSQGVIKRFGVVVRHHELGYLENAMVVWDVPDDEVGVLGRMAAKQEGVTLCYRRNRQHPDWPFNLFCMVHGTDRRLVHGLITKLEHRTGLDHFESQVLFSCKRYKQCGARYVANGRN
jgi:DNA-binding Lrp family transcriptional regulator